MERSDIPAALRGHRSALFGNLERLRDFHQDFLLPELECSQTYPHRIANIFLRYVSNFKKNNKSKTSFLEGSKPLYKI